MTIDTAGSPFESVNCAGCQAPVVAVPDARNPLCVECRRAANDITWPWFTPVGDWHPSVGYPSPGQRPPGQPADEKPPVGVREGTRWWWACLACSDSGPADTAGHAVALEGVHRAYACPQTRGELAGADPVKAGSRPPGLPRGVSWPPQVDERVRRDAWARNLRRRYSAPPPRTDHDT